MDISTTVISILVALLGGGGGAALIKFLLEFIDKKRGNTIDRKITAAVQAATQPLLDALTKHEEKIDELIACDERFDRNLKEIRLDTTRTQLYFKMKHDTHNHDTIFKIAHRYFVELKGDWVATVDFQKWADKEKVKIPSAIMTAIAENDAKK